MVPIIEVQRLLNIRKPRQFCRGFLIFIFMRVYVDNKVDNKMLDA